MHDQTAERDEPKPMSAPGLEFEQDGSLFVVKHNGARHFLNATAAIVLQLCDGKTSSEAIAATLLELYGEVPDIDTHVQKCLDDLARRDLLIAPAGP